MLRQKKPVSIDFDTKRLPLVAYQNLHLDNENLVCLPSHLSSKLLDCRFANTSHLKNLHVLRNYLDTTKVLKRCICPVNGLVIMTGHGFLGRLLGENRCLC